MCAMQYFMITHLSFIFVEELSTSAASGTPSDVSDFM